MRPLTEIRADIDRESARRTDLWKRLGEGHDAAVIAEIKRLEDRLAALWDEDRVTRAQLRFGDRAHIITRARAEERLERAA